MFDIDFKPIANSIKFYGENYNFSCFNLTLCYKLYHILWIYPVVYL